MSRLDIKAQVTLLKEAKMYFEDVKPVSKAKVKEKKGAVVLTQEHIEEWLQVFYDDRIRMDTCNQASVKM
ncbi:hypothetical protein GJV85_11020 [Sulfurimonas aquatica]|uniref:Uncharacterized protein n=1 Tax=Sulfurimonas aquatica TaxID=2672570 RepID=A0A975B1P7_9BACT|nr:hypothetical protein [Sulfurimonas aquatica]QSZ42616.1 hypothetical protein GJV85_11020 [Sulfurimonas aquatica]